MLVIRAEQLRALEEPIKRRRTDRLVFRLKRNEESLAETDVDELYVFVDNGAHIARRYGIYGEEETLLFLSMLLEYGESFGEEDDTLWAGEILRRKDLTALEKLTAIVDVEEAHVNAEES